MKNLSVKLKRQWADKNQSTGILLIIDNNTGQPVFGSMCIERGERHNQRNVSNIPEGIYPLRFTWSPKFKRFVWLIDEVPNRSGIRIHPANFWTQLNGCVAPGIRLKDLNKDGYYDVTSSTRTTADFERVLKGLKETTIEIINDY